MFYTCPDAELPIPVGLASNGEQCWHWMELGITTTYFFCTVQVCTDDGDEFTRHLWFSEIDSVVKIASQSGKQLRLVRVDVFTPGHVNGSDGYRFDEVREVWRSNKSPMTLRFVLADGGILRQSFGDEPPKDEETGLTLAVRVQKFGEQELDLASGNVVKLKPASDAGAGKTVDDEERKLAEIDDKVNVLFSGDQVRDVDLHTIPSASSPGRDG